MLNLKTLNTALEQLESERGIPRDRIIEAIEDALAAAYKKDFGKKGQVVRAEFEEDTGMVNFFQVKTVVDESLVRFPEDGEEEESEDSQPAARGNARYRPEPEPQALKTTASGEPLKTRYNPEHHILIDDAKKIKKDSQLGEEIVFPLESKDDFGRIAAQTAKQVIIQRIREAERTSAFEEYEKRKGDIVSGIVQKVERGSIYVDIGRSTGIIPREEQIPMEFFKTGDRIKAYLYAVEESPRDITLQLSRSHPKLLHKLMEVEVPEIASGVVEIKTMAREPGSRSKVAVFSNDEHIDPVGSCVGGRGVRVSTVMNELHGEKIDIIEWSADQKTFIERSLSPAHAISVTLDEASHRAEIEVAPEQYSLAIGKGGQNARLAAKLTGWKIDIRQSDGPDTEPSKTETKKLTKEETKEENALTKTES